MDDIGKHGQVKVKQRRRSDLGVQRIINLQDNMLQFASIRFHTIVSIALL